MSGFRVARIVLLVGFLLLLVTLHGRGSTYNELHIVYIVLIVALLIGSFAIGGGRRRMMGRGGTNGPRGRNFGGGSFGSPPPPPPVVRDNPDPEADGPSGPGAS
jgi:hypothetical protein